MKGFFYHIFKNLLRCFTGNFLWWHVAAITLTILLVLSGFDWNYFVFFNHSRVQSLLFGAVILGGLIPLTVPLGLFLASYILKKAKTMHVAYALGQSALLGLLVSDFYKALTGRAHPLHSLATAALSDNSREFLFGFLRGGVFWGWPSTHTTIAFTMAVAFFQLFPKQRWVCYGAIAYAFYVGLGVSMSIHWFSDFAAGAIFGTVIGTVVGKSFYRKYLGDKRGRG